jgi:diacylglycerol O-acyltransferase
VSALALLSSFVDQIPDAQPVTLARNEYRPAPSRREMFADNARHQGDVVRRSLTSLVHPAELLRHLTVGARQLASVARQGRAPAISLNRPVGPGRRLMLVRANLAATKQIAHRSGATVNDVLLTALAGGARGVLDHRGELHPGLVLRVSVAASIRGTGDAGEAEHPGNRTGVRVVPVSVAETNPVKRLEQIAAATAAQRGSPPYQPGGRLLQRWMVHVMFRQRLVNLLLSDLPGPTERFFFAGALVEEIFQIGVVQGNLALGVCVLSYAGQLNVAILADADAVPDIANFAKGFSDTLDQLAVSS